MRILETISAYIIPSTLAIVALVIFFGKKDYFSDFLDGAKDGALSGVKILPTMCALIVGVSAFTGSGAAKALSSICAPILNTLGIPSEIFSLVLTRPLSGSASIASYTELLSQYGADSFACLCASVILASTDTVIYVISVYFSKSQIRRTRYALPCALFVSAFSVFLSCILCRFFFE